MAYKTLKFSSTPFNWDRVVAQASESIEIKEQTETFFAIGYPTAIDYNTALNRWERFVEFTEWKERAEEDRVGNTLIVDILE